jgi:hypothetical protein
MLVLCPNHHLQIELSEEVRVDWERREIRFNGAKRRLKVHPAHAKLARTWVKERQIKNGKLLKSWIEATAT